MKGIFVAALAVLALSGSALAQTFASASSQSSTSVLDALSAVVDSDLAFGRVIKPTSGVSTISIDANGVVSETGDGDAFVLDPVGTVALYRAITRPNQFVFWAAPYAELTMSNGSSTLDVDFTIQLSNVSGDTGTEATLIVFGSFDIDQNTEPGEYVGTYTVIAVED